MNEQEIKFQFLQEFVKRVSADLGTQLISITLLAPAENKVILHKSTNPMVDNSQSSLYQLSIIKSLTRAMDYFPGVINHDIKLLSIIYQGQKHVVFFPPNRTIVTHIIAEETANMKLIELVVTKHNNDLTAELVQRVGAGVLGTKVDLRV